MTLQFRESINFISFHFILIEDRLISKHHVIASSGVYSPLLNRASSSDDRKWFKVELDLLAVSKPRDAFLLSLLFPAGTKVLTWEERIAIILRLAVRRLFSLQSDPSLPVRFLEELWSRWMALTLFVVPSFGVLLVCKFWVLQICWRVFGEPLIGSSVDRIFRREFSIRLPFFVRECCFLHVSCFRCLVLVA